LIKEVFFGPGNFNFFPRNQTIVRDYNSHKSHPPLLCL
jgi:hypothetical protein